MASLKSPSKALSLLETRALLEVATAYPASSLLRYLPPGDGHPVLVIPAFMTTDAFTSRFRRSLRQLGYTAKPWGLGQNLGVRMDKVEQAALTLDAMYRRYGRKVSVIGWSLGGIYARALANLMPDQVRQVITLGSPFAVKLDSKAGVRSGIAALYNMLNPPDPELMAQTELTHRSPDCGFTSIFTKTDGVVDYRLCLDRHSHQAQNIRVIGSHAGLTHNPLAFWLVANRLQQAEDAWQPLKLKGLQRMLYQSVDVDGACPEVNAIRQAELLAATN